MRSVVLLALLWQTAVVMGLGAIHAPNNKYGGGYTLPWVGTRMWSTKVETFVALDLLFSPSAQGEVFVTGLHDQDSTTTSAVALNPRDGKVQWREDDMKGDFATPGFSASRFPYVVAPTANGASLLMFNKSTRTVDVIRTYRLPTAFPGPIFAVGGQFLWITGDHSSIFGHHSSMMSITKIDPKSGASSTVQTSLSYDSSTPTAGLNYLFASDGSLISCFLPTGEFAWSFGSAEGVYKVSPSPHSDIFLVFFSNTSASLFNAAKGGEWIWTADGVHSADPDTIDAFFTADFVLIRGNLGQLTAVDLSIGKRLWSDASQSEDIHPLNCVLESGVFVYFVQPGYTSLKLLTNSLSPYRVIGVDLKTGNGLFNYTIDLSDSIHASNSQFSSPRIHCDGRSDVYFSVVSNVNNSVVQRLTFAPPRPLRP